MYVAAVPAGCGGWNCSPELSADQVGHSQIHAAAAGGELHPPRHHPQDPGITIRIRAREENGSLYVEVTDTGVGADAALLNDYLDYRDVPLKVTHGFGIRNVNERLKLRFGDGAGLRYSNYDGQKLLARLTLPAGTVPLPDGQ